MGASGFWRCSGKTIWRIDHGTESHCTDGTADPGVGIMPSGKKWSDAETSRLLASFNKSTNTELAQLFPSRSLSAIHKRARKLGLRVPKDIEFRNRSDARKAEKSSNWRGGVRRTSKGYRQLLRPAHPRADSCGYVMEHIAVWEEHAGRLVPPDYVIHHINGVKDDNRIENLALMTRAEHTKLHHIGANRSEETVHRITEKRRLRI